MDINTSYGVVFLIGTVALVCTVFILYNLRDIHKERPKNVKTVGISASFGRMLPLLKENPEFKKVLTCRVLIAISSMTLSMSVLFGRNYLVLNASQISTLVSVQILGTTLGGLLWGQLSARIDNRMTVKASFFTGIMIPSIALFLMIFHTGLSDSVIFVLMILMVLMTGMNAQAWLIGAYNYQLDVVLPADRPISIMMTCIITIPFGMFTSLSGLIAERLGFMPLMLTIFIANFIGYNISLRLLRRTEIPEYIKEMEQCSI